MRRRAGRGSASPAWVVACRGLAAGALAIGLVIGVLAVFGDADPSGTAAIAAPSSVVVSGDADTLPGLTTTTPTSGPVAASPTDPTAPFTPTAPTTGGGTPPSTPAADPAADPAPAAPGPAPGPTPTPVAYPKAFVSLGGGGSINVSMTGFSPGESLFVVCYRLPYEDEDLPVGQKWVQIGGYAGARSADGDGMGSGSCSLDGARIGAHVFAVVNDSEAYSNHLQL